MKNQSDYGVMPTPKTLHQLVKLLANNARPSALRSNSFIVNEVPNELMIITDENILATVLSRLLYCFVNNAENSCIRVTANDYDDIIFVNMKSTRGLNNEAIDSDLQQAQAYAKKMNGNVGLTKDDDKVNGIVFSFPNLNFANKKGSTGPHNWSEAMTNLY